MKGPGSLHSIAGAGNSTILRGAVAPARMRRASTADAHFLAEVLEMAGRGHRPRGPWDFLFPVEAERRTALACIAGGDVVSWCHHSFVHVAEVDGVAAAALAGFEPTGIGPEALGPALHESFARLGWSEEKAASAMEAVAPFLPCFPDMPAGTWIVENVGTRPEARRRGLVRALLERVLEEGRARGFGSAQISCLLGNDSAMSAYERAGFEVVEERRDPGFEALVGSPGFARMTMRLR